MDSLRRDAERGVRWTGLASMSTGALQFLQIAVLANFLTPIEFGLMGTVLLVLQLQSALSDLGVSMAFIQAPKVEPAQRTALYAMHVGVATAFALAQWWFAGPLARLLGEPDLAPLLAAAGLAIPLAALAAQFRMHFHKELRMGPVSVIEILATGSYVLISIPLGINGFGAWSLVAGYLAQAVVTAVGTVWVGWRQYPITAAPSFKGTAPLLRFGWFSMWEKVVIFLNSRLDQVLITTALGVEALGLYTMALNLVIYPLQRVQQAVSQVMFPLFAKQQDDRGSLARGYLGALRLLNLFHAPVLAGIAVTAPVFIPLIIGPAWVSAIPVVQILALYAYWRSTGSPGGNLLMATGRTDTGFHWNLLMLCATVPTMSVAARWGGVEGIAWGLVLLHTAMAPVYYRMVIRTIIGEHARAYAHILLQPVLLAGIMAAGVWGVHQALAGDGLVTLLLLIGTGMLIYPLLLRIFLPGILGEYRRFLPDRFR